MSHYDYLASRELAASDPPFYGLIMAAMRVADTINLENLKDAFPETWTEFYQRYNSPGGYLPNEQVLPLPKHTTHPEE